MSEDHRWNVAEADQRRLMEALRTDGGEEIDDHIRGDQTEGDILQLDIFQAVDVVERDEHFFSAAPPAVSKEAF
ncbi:hypothetical protein GCM10007937_34250 [Mesorhizobium albiziae]|nr:hypothetical protein GCM10007937_34250 [Mesorhizobium albiziae]